MPSRAAAIIAASSAGDSSGDDREGTGSGLDLAMISAAAAELPVPVIANGGVGSLQDIHDGLAAGARAVAAGSYFVLHGPHRAVLITYLKEPDFVMLAAD